MKVSHEKKSTIKEEWQQWSKQREHTTVSETVSFCSSVTFQSVTGSVAPLDGLLLPVTIPEAFGKGLQYTADAEMAPSFLVDSVWLSDSTN